MSKEKIRVSILQELAGAACKRSLAPARKELHELVAEEEEWQQRAAHEARVAELAEAIKAPSAQSLAQAKRRAEERAEVLAAALACLWHFKPERDSIAALAELLDQKASLFWSGQNSPPIGRGRLERMLCAAVKLPDK